VRKCFVAQMTNALALQHNEKYTGNVQNIHIIICKVKTDQYIYQWIAFSE